MIHPSVLLTRASVAIQKHKKKTKCRRNEYMHLRALKENIHYIKNITFQEQRQACAVEDA
jgi:hypothetical protein